MHVSFQLAMDHIHGLSGRRVALHVVEAHSDVSLFVQMTSSIIVLKLMFRKKIHDFVSCNHVNVSNRTLCHIP